MFFFSLLEQFHSKLNAYKRKHLSVFSKLYYFLPEMYGEHLRFFLSLTLLPVGWLALQLTNLMVRLNSLERENDTPDEPEEEESEEVYCPIVKLRLRTPCSSYCSSHCPSVIIRALLDTGSGVSYISGRVMEKLQLDPQPVSISNRFYWRQSRFEDDTFSQPEISLNQAVAVIMEALEDPRPAIDTVVLYVFPGFRLPLHQNPPSFSLRQLSAVKNAQLIDDPDLVLEDTFTDDPTAIDLVIGQDLLSRKILEEKQMSFSLSINQVILSTRFGYVLQGGGGTVGSAGEALLQQLPEPSQGPSLYLAGLLLNLLLDERTYFWRQWSTYRRCLILYLSGTSQIDTQMRSQQVSEDTGGDQMSPRPVTTTTRPLFPRLKTINLPTLRLVVRNPTPIHSPALSLRVLLDSGSKWSLISPKAVNQLALPQHLVLPPKILTDFTGTPYHLVRSVILRLHLPTDEDSPPTPNRNSNPEEEEDDFGILIRLFVDPTLRRLPRDGPRDQMIDEATFHHLELSDTAPEEGEVIEAIIGQDLLTSTFLIEPEQVSVLSPSNDQTSSWAFIPTIYGTAVQGVAYEKPPSRLHSP